MTATATATTAPVTRQFVGHGGVAYTLVAHTSTRMFARIDNNPSWGVVFFKVKDGPWVAQIRSIVPPDVWVYLKELPPLQHVLDIMLAVNALNQGA